MVMNMKQFNRKYGCLYYMYPCEAIPPGALVYPPDIPCANCTHSEIQQWAKEAKRKVETVHGIKVPSPLASYIDIVNSIPINYVRAVLKSVTKQFLMLWLSTKNSKSSFYLGREVKKSDQVLMSIKPPSEFHRTPRPIEITIKFWKACEI